MSDCRRGQGQKKGLGRAWGSGRREGVVDFSLELTQSRAGRTRPRGDIAPNSMLRGEIDDG